MRTAGRPPTSKTVCVAPPSPAASAPGHCARCPPLLQTHWTGWHRPVARERAEFDVTVSQARVPLIDELTL